MKKVLCSLLIVALLISTVGCSNSSLTSKNSNGAEGSDFPNKQITFVVPYSPGGLSDFVSRTASKIAEKELGVPIVCVNKTGANGGVGLTYVGASEPDGYTLGLAPIELVMLNALGQASIEPKDYDYIGRAVIAVPVLAVKTNAPWNSLDELLEYAKNSHGKLLVGTDGAGGMWDTSTALLEKQAGVEFNKVAYSEGTALAVAALMGGHVDAVVGSIPEVWSNVEAGDLKVLFNFGEERSASLPDVPTVKEQGIDLAIYNWIGMVAPKGLPEDVLKKIEASYNKAINSEEFAKAMTERGLEVNYLNSKDYEEFALKQWEFYSKEIPELN